MERQTLYLECVSGISGDMTVAALLDLGADQRVLERALESLPVDGYETVIRQVKKSGLDMCDFDVVLDHVHENHDHDMEYLHGHAHEHEGGHHHEHGHDEGEHHDGHGEAHHHEHGHDENSHDGEHCHEHDKGHHHEHGEHHHHGHGHHHADEIFTSWGLETPAAYTREDITHILAELDKEETYGIVLRAKGMVPGVDGGWIYFDYVPEESNVRDGKPDVTGKVCVIGSKLKEDRLAELFCK